VRRELPDGYELDDDRERIDVDAVHAYVGGVSYWAKGRSHERMQAAIDGAARVIGLYKDGEQVGFARVISDCATFAYLADVYVLEPHRGGGRGVALVREAIEGEPWSGLTWHLKTKDAHSLYEKLGFVPSSDRAMDRPAR
jgi:GNAT superfamily N-acetyltransferase